jgi:uncharacterized protein
MDLNLEVPQGHNFVRSIGDEGIRVNNEYFTRPFILSASQLESDWNVVSIEDLNENNLQAIFEMNPDVVLIGCGGQQKFLPPAIQMLFLSRNIGVEIMITEAACYTFNVLVAEERRVVAAIFNQ